MNFLKIFDGIQGLQKTSYDKQYKNDFSDILNESK